MISGGEANAPFKHLTGWDATRKVKFIKSESSQKKMLRTTGECIEI